MANTVLLQGSELSPRNNLNLGSLRFITFLYDTNTSTEFELLVAQSGSYYTIWGIQLYEVTGNNQWELRSSGVVIMYFYLSVNSGLFYNFYPLSVNSNYGGNIGIRGNGAGDILRGCLWYDTVRTLKS